MFDFAAVLLLRKRVPLVLAGSSAGSSATDLQVLNSMFDGAELAIRINQIVSLSEDYTRSTDNFER